MTEFEGLSRTGLHAALTEQIKTLTRIEPVHVAQLLTYLRVSTLRVGLLLNFNTEVLKNGIRRVVL